MAEKIVYTALPKEDVDNMFEMLDALARLMDNMAGDPGVSVATQTSAHEAAEGIRLKLRVLKLRAQIL